MLIAGFRPISFVYNPGLPEKQRWVIVDSLTLSMGDAVQVLPSVTIGGIEPADATSDSIYGYLVGFVTPKNLPLELAKSSDYDGM